jgi:FMN-dependent NADH-azoreductase
MKNILVITSSLNSTASRSSELVEQYLETIQQHESVSIRRRDLGKQPIEHLSEEEFNAWLTPEAERTEAQQTLARLSDELVAELQAADTIVLGVPMYNFGIPSTLKAWIDHVARAGKTFNYTEQGPVGLLENKQVIIMASRGGMYANTPGDTQTPYLRQFFNFLGIEDVTFIYAEGLNMPGSDDRLAESRSQIQAMLNTDMVN